MLNALDPRRHPYREDVAAAHLRDRVRAQRYVEGEPRQVAAPSAPLRAAPRFDAPLLTEALSGEIATVYDARDGWAWCQLASDGYVGFMTADCLSTMIETPTHKVVARATFIYPAPDIKKPPITRLSFGAEPIVSAIEGKFAELSRGGFVHLAHLTTRGDRAKDFVRVAERFVGTPYLWGGKTSNGIDCSALVQLALSAAGVACPRDSDMQEAELGERLPKPDLGALRRGDLIFWRGHVAVAASPDFIIHANAFHMETVVEPVRRAVDRIAADSGPVVSIRRLPMAQESEVAPPQPEQAKLGDRKSAALAEELQRAGAADKAAAGQDNAPGPKKAG
jgi:cell wall-associated NlpC family hydrolase